MRSIRKLEKKQLQRDARQAGIAQYDSRHSVASSISDESDLSDSGESPNSAQKLREEKSKMLLIDTNLVETKVKNKKSMKKKQQDQKGESGIWRTALG